MKKAKQGKQKKGIPDLFRLASPIAVPGASVLRRHTYQQTVTLSASATTGQKIGSSEMRTTSLEWASSQARYQEYRLLAIRVSHVAGYRATTNDFVSFCADRTGSAVAPTLASTTWAGDGARVFNLNNTSAKPITYEVRATDLEDQNFTPTTQNSTSFQMLVWFQGSTASISVGVQFVEFIVELRGTQ